jgi:hypothetical protein
MKFIPDEAIIGIPNINTWHTADWVDPYDGYDDKYDYEPPCADPCP